jgi:Arc/MetJ-type ribon-helix-helix transcriptional regulator
MGTPSTVGFRPTDDDSRIIDSLRRDGESNSDVLRRGLRALERVEWEQQARADMARLADEGEDLSQLPDEWEYTEDGDIRMVDTGIVVPARREAGR